jgi:hypothetical protein
MDVLRIASVFTQLIYPGGIGVNKMVFPKRRDRSKCVNGLPSTGSPDAREMCEPGPANPSM